MTARTGRRSAIPSCNISLVLYAQSQRTRDQLTNWPTDQSIAWLVQLSTNKLVADIDAVETRLGVVRWARLSTRCRRPASRHFQGHRVVIRQRMSSITHTDYAQRTRFNFKHKPVVSDFYTQPPTATSWLASCLIYAWALLTHHYNT